MRHKRSRSNNISDKHTEKIRPARIDFSRKNALKIIKFWDTPPAERRNARRPHAKLTLGKLN
jgi:hypothetical protein